MKTLSDSYVLGLYIKHLGGVYDEDKEQRVIRFAREVIAESHEMLRQKFSSGNSVTVSSVRVTREEYEAVCNGERK